MFDDGPDGAEIRAEIRAEILTLSASNASPDSGTGLRIPHWCPSGLQEKKITPETDQ